jgi:hypothetical protein
MMTDTYFHFHVVAKEASMFRVYFTNFGYFAASDFASFNDALAHAKKCCFDAVIEQAGRRAATWSPLTGLSAERWVNT